jgi:hypothetical protein
VELVGQAGLEELRVDRAAALDKQPAHAAPGQVGQDDGQAERVAGLQDGSGPCQACGRVAGRAVRHVDQHGLAGGGAGEEAGGGVEVAGAGDRDADRVGQLAAGQPGFPPGGGADPQPGVVAADRGRADQDRVGVGADLVDPVQVRVAGQDQALAGGVVQVAVH